MVTKQYRRKNTHKLDKTDRITLLILKTDHGELDLQELADKVGETQEKIETSISKLFEL